MASERKRQFRRTLGTLFVFSLGLLGLGLTVDWALPQAFAQAGETQAAQGRLVAFRFKELQVRHSSLRIPMPRGGEKSFIDTGEMSVRLASPSRRGLGAFRLSELDLRTGEVFVHWPVEVATPPELQPLLGTDTYAVDMVGVGLLDSERGEMILVDVGAPFRIPLPGPDVEVNCVNNANKVADVRPDQVRPGSELKVRFVSVTKEDFERYPIAAMLRSAHELAGVEMTPIQMRGVMEQYRAEPTREMVYYYSHTGKFESADVEGTATIEFLDSVRPSGEFVPRIKR